jgi:hypothetical protein
MRETIELRLSDERSIFVETEVTKSRNQELGAGGGSSSITKSFDIVSATLSDVAGNLEKHLSELERGPNKVMVEISADIRAGGNIFIVNGGTQGGIKVQLTWERDD